MTEPSTNNEAVQNLLEQAKQLTPIQEEHLLDLLYDQYWERKFLPKDIEPLKPHRPRKSLFNIVFGKLLDPQMELEHAYQDLQISLIHVRQAVSQAIATQKHLVEQIAKNQDYNEILENNVAEHLATNKNKEAEIARNRISENEEAIKNLVQQRDNHQEHLEGMRSTLKYYEKIAQTIYTKKQILISRRKAAVAIKTAKTIIAEKFSIDFDSLFSKLEKQVTAEESEDTLLNQADSTSNEDDDLGRSIKALRRSSWVLERMEEIFAKHAPAATSSVKNE